MGVFDFFSRRRQRESAVQAPASNETALGSFAAGEGQPVVGGQVGAAASGGDPINLQGATSGVEALAALSQLGPMIQQAIASGNVQVQVGEPQTIDMRGAAGLGDELREIMGRHGVDADTGSATKSIDASAYGDMQQQILAALAKHGVGPGAGGTSIDFQAGSDNDK